MLVKIIDRHAGRWFHEGGQYGEWRIVDRGGGRVVFGSTAQWGSLRDAFCTNCGQFHRDECAAGPTIMTADQVNDLICRHPTQAPLPWEADEGVELVVDATGHEPELDRHGGCVVCHPA